MKKSAVLFLFISTIALHSCRGGDTPKSQPQATQTSPVHSYEFTINAIGNTMSDMAFDTKEIKVATGSMVKINLTNTASDEAMLHNIVFVKAGSEKEVAMEGLNFKTQHYFNANNPNVIAGTPVAKPKESFSIEFTAPEPGNYSFICTYPGHWQAMRGVLIVE